MKTRIIDHFVYAVPDLDRAMDQLEERLGVRPVFGGYHKTQGTKNALLNLGEGCYLEILAIDNQNTDIKAPRWMGIDLITESRITRWAIKSEDIDYDSKILKSFHNHMGQVSEGSRKTTSGETLAWKMILPLANPEIELIPFMLDWSDSAFHPTEKLENICLIKDITFAGNIPDKSNLVFDELDISHNITRSVNNKISVTIESPNGLFILK